MTYRQRKALEAQAGRQSVHEQRRELLSIICTTVCILAALVLAFLAFDRAMTQDARNLCANPATATDAVCKQAGMRRI